MSKHSKEVRKAYHLIDKLEEQSKRMETIIGILEYLADDNCELPNSTDVYLTILNVYRMRERTKPLHVVYVASKVGCEGL